MGGEMSKKIINVDLREVPVFQRHPMVFEAWEELGVGETLQIKNDHDPKPLSYQFEGEYKDLYEWEYVKEGADEWVVNITKVSTGEPPVDEGTKKRVEEALEEIRPYLKADGGDVSLVGIDEAERVVRVRLEGACGGCPSAAMTLKGGVEKAVKEHAPEIRTVESV